MRPLVSDTYLLLQYLLAREMVAGDLEEDANEARVHQERGLGRVAPTRVQPESSAYAPPRNYRSAIFIACSCGLQPVADPTVASPNPRASRRTPRPPRVMRLWASAWESRCSILAR